MTTKTKKQTKKPFAVSVPSEDHYDAWEVLINGTKQRVARMSAEEINAAAKAWHAERCKVCPHVKAEKKLLAEFCEETSGLGDFRESKVCDGRPGLVPCQGCDQLLGHRDAQRRWRYVCTSKTGCARRAIGVGEDKSKPMTVGTWQRMLGESRKEVRAKKPKRVRGTKPKTRRTR